MAKYKKRKDSRYCTSITLDKKYLVYGKTCKEVDKKIIELKVRYEKRFNTKKFKCFIQGL